ncbi:MAG: AraC family transcriptional regulator [Clostridia bacterium]|nr:AraC family transcriptional regulator [Clostridia bacterium]MBR4117041.1 AraC family transcriptional regulator [Clostridia bacterium]
MYINFQNFGFNAAAKTRYFNGKSEYPERMHQLPEILCIIDGSFELTVDGITEVAKKGDICVITPFRTHSWHTPESCTVWQLVISMDFAEDFLSGENLYISGTKSVFTPSKALFDYVTEVFPGPHSMQSNIDSDLQRYCTIKSIVYSVFTEYMRRIPKKITSLNHNALTKLLLYINEHYTENIDLTTAAKELGYNKTYLSRCISSMPNVNFRKLVNSLRIDKAKNLLATTELKIFDVAEECGFANERTLQRTFIEIVGKTPREYRTFKQQNIE